MKKVAISSRDRSDSAKTSSSESNRWALRGTAIDPVVALASVSGAPVLLDLQNADGAARDDHAGRGADVGQHQRIDRVAITRQRARHEAPIVRIRETGGQRARQRQSAELSVVLQLTDDPRGDSTTT